MGTKARWLGPVIGPSTLNCSILSGGDTTVTVVASLGTSESEELWVSLDHRLFRSRIVHQLTEEHQPALLFGDPTSGFGFRDANATFDRFSPLAAVSSF